MGQSKIQHYYGGKHIFITGATGFMGKLLVEKLLRTCSQLDKLYLLVREKKGKTNNERFQEIFDCIIFEKLKLEHPNFIAKVELVSGDCSKNNLGINEENLELLKSKVNIIFHIAAIVNFEASLNQSVKANTCSTKQLLDLACTFQDLEAFVYVSTAYANGFKPNVEEKVYAPPLGAKEIMKMCNTMDETRLKNITPSLIEGWPNTYTFSKCLSENIVQEYSQRIPVAIVRPSQVISTAYEPIKGWIGNYYGPTGIISAAGIGLMRTFILDQNCIIDAVPCDMVTNFLIVVPWNLNSRKQHTSSKSSKEKGVEHLRKLYKDQVKVYNFVSGKSNPITYKAFLQKSIKYLYKDPPEKCIWSLIFITTSSIRLFKLLHVFLHVVPGFIIDLFLKITGRKPKMLQIYNKIKKITLIFKSFSLNEWKFDDSNVQSLWNELNEIDKELFRFNIKNLDWDDYVITNARGIRVHILQDKNENSRYAKIRYMILRFANAILWASLTLMSLCGIYKGAKLICRL